MARKILFFMILILLFLIPVVFASTTDITIRTKPNHKILITANKAGVSPIERIKSLAPYKNTGIIGQLKVSLTTTERTVDLKLDLITTDSKPDLNNVFEGIPTTGEPVFINLFPGNFTYTVGSPETTVVNTTGSNLTSLNETNNTQVITNSSLTPVNKTNLALTSNFSITASVSKFYKDNSKIIFYILIVIAVIIIALIVVFIERKLPKRTSTYNSPIKHVPFSPSSQSVSNHSLMAAERKLKEAQAEIELIKRKNEEIRAAERKLQEDTMRLDKLRRGY
jgi:hypothetical protein